MESMPVAITAMVGSPRSRALRWAQMSVPRARPLTTQGAGETLEREETSLSHHSLP